MGSFIAISLISALVISINSLITYEILREVWKVLPKMRVSPRLRVILIIIPIFAIHMASIWIYAIVYFLVSNFTSIGKFTLAGKVVGIGYQGFVECLYFAGATYTSLSLGSISPTDNLRMLACAEVLNGLVMLGWTISFTYLTMEKFWTLPHRHHKSGE